MGNFLDFFPLMIFSPLLFFWNSVYFYTGTLYHLILFSYFLHLGHFTQFSKRRLQLYLSALILNFKFIFFNFKIFFVYSKCSFYPVLVSLLKNPFFFFFLISGLRLGTGQLWGCWCQELVNFMLNPKMIGPNYGSLLLSQFKWQEWLAGIDLSIQDRYYSSSIN